MREDVAPGGHVAVGAAVGLGVAVGVGAGVLVGVAAAVGLAVPTGEAETSVDGAADGLAEANATWEAEADAASILAVGTTAALLPPNGGRPRRPLSSVPTARITRPMPMIDMSENRPQRCWVALGEATVSLARTVPRA